MNKMLMYAALAFAVIMIIRGQKQKKEENEAGGSGGGGGGFSGGQIPIIGIDGRPRIAPRPMEQMANRGSPNRGGNASATVAGSGRHR